VAEEINRIGQPSGIHALPIYGGQDYRWQMQGLRNKPQIIVGTPGRLVDHITLRKTIKVDHVRMLVLDEADEMLDMGFIGDIETILSKTPKERQTLFSPLPCPLHQETGLLSYETCLCRQHFEKMTVAQTAVLCRGPEAANSRPCRILDSSARRSLCFRPDKKRGRAGGRIDEGAIWPADFTATLTSRSVQHHAAV
jgi:hypothetical protein